ncbi:uncharacterized protein [Macaca fascicularis]|uniref:uncharacterized protein n=1 Tax=Macaca fascicularis TaxID=9541 RepID=UPI0032B041E7
MQPENEAHQSERTADLSEEMRKTFKSLCEANTSSSLPQPHVIDEATKEEKQVDERGGLGGIPDHTEPEPHGLTHSASLLTDARCRLARTPLALRVLPPQLGRVMVPAETPARVESGHLAGGSGFGGGREVEEAKNAAGPTCGVGVGGGWGREAGGSGPQGFGLEERRGRAGAAIPTGRVGSAAAALGTPQAPRSTRRPSCLLRAPVLRPSPSPADPAGASALPPSAFHDLGATRAGPSGGCFPAGRRPGRGRERTLPAAGKSSPSRRSGRLRGSRRALWAPPRGLRERADPGEAASARTQPDTCPRGSPGRLSNGREGESRTAPVPAGGAPGVGSPRLRCQPPTRRTFGPTARRARRAALRPLPLPLPGPRVLDGG